MSLEAIILIVILGVVVLLEYYSDKRNKNLIKKLLEEIKISKENQEILKSLAYVDYLTDVNNRRSLEKILDHELKRIKRTKGNLSIVMLDLDNFKELNDSLGHTTGDKILRDFAKIMKEISREIDIVCRYGGDEFVIILPETNEEGAKKFSIKIKEKIEKNTFEIKDKKIKIGVTIGILELNPNYIDLSIEEIIRIVDQRMYKNKNGKL